MNTRAASYSATRRIASPGFDSVRFGRSRLLRGLSSSGAWLSILCLTLIGSAVRSLRVEVGGLLVHPYLFLLFPLFLFAAPARITRFPKRMLVALIAFEFFYILSIGMGMVSVDETLKIGAVGVTIITTALLVRTKFDFRAAVIALSIAGAVLSFQNIVSGGELFGIGKGTEAVIADKNAFSLYVLPALLLAMTVILDRTAGKSTRIFLAACILPITIAIFSSENRSGWLGGLCVGVMVYGRGRSIRSTLLLSVLVFSAYYGITHYTNSSSAVERRVDQTVEGNSGDNIRLDIVSASFLIGLEHPLFGVSPKALPFELARRLPKDGVTVYSLGPAKMLDPHNTILHLIGGSGIITFGLFVYLAWQLWKRPGSTPPFGQPLIKGLNSSHTILRMMMVLWLVRGMFTREILYSPSFCIGLGLCIGLCIYEGFWLPGNSIPRQGDVISRAPYLPFGTSSN